MKGTQWKLPPTQDLGLSPSCPGLSWYLKIHMSEFTYWVIFQIHKLLGLSTNKYIPTSKNPTLSRSTTTSNLYPSKYKCSFLMSSLTHMYKYIRQEQSRTEWELCTIYVYKHNHTSKFHICRAMYLAFITRCLIYHLQTPKQILPVLSWPFPDVQTGGAMNSLTTMVPAERDYIDGLLSCFSSCVVSQCLFTAHLMPHILHV